MSSPRCLVFVVYFGEFQPWFSLFLESASRVKSCDFLLVTDNVNPVLPDNFRYLNWNLSDLREALSRASGYPCELPRPYKLCDFKPAYGHVFEKYSEGYDYYGMVDEDMVLGDLDKFILPYMEQGMEVISALPEQIAGFFTLFKNHSAMRQLYKTDPVFEQVATDPENWAYDETSWKKGEAFENSNFTDLVRQYLSVRKLDSVWGMPIREKLMIRGRYYEWNDSTLTENGEKELAFYHYYTLKRATFFHFHSTIHRYKMFSFDFFGFYKGKGTPTRRLLRHWRFLKPTKFKRFLHFLKTRKHLT